MGIPSIRDIAIQIRDHTKVFKTVGGSGEEGRIIDSVNTPTENLPAAFVVLYDSDADDDMVSNSVYMNVEWTIRVYVVVDASQDPSGMAAAVITFEDCLPDLTKKCLQGWQPYDWMIRPLTYKGHGIESQSGSRLVYWVDFRLVGVMNEDDCISYNENTLKPVIEIGYDGSIIKKVDVSSLNTTN